MSDNLLSEAMESTVNTMPAGLKMDLLVTRILEGGVSSRNPVPYSKDTVSYSKDIKNAWRVVEWCMEWGEGDLFLEWWRDGEWFICNADLYSRHQENFPKITARSDRVGDDELPSLPLAICRFAIKTGLKQGIVTEDMVRNE